MTFHIKSIENQTGYYIYKVNFETNFGFIEGQIVSKDLLEFNETYKLTYDKD